jgi:hypothetical protein
LQAIGVGDVGTDRDRLVSGEVSGFLAGPGVDFSNGDLRTFAGEQDRGGTANPVTGARDEGHRAGESWHRSLLLNRKFENHLRPAFT